jgi:hypothetical protein
MVILTFGRGRSMSNVDRFWTAFEVFPTLAWLEVFALLVDALAIVILMMLGTTLRAQAGWTGRAEDMSFLVSAIIVLVVLAVIGVTHDLARIAAVERRLGVHASIHAAFGVLGERGFGVLVAWGWRAMFACAAMLGGALLASAVGVVSPGAIAVSAFAHQAGLLIAVTWRASFLDRALAWVRRDPPVVAEEH